jgi:RNA polymerase sigma-70 factor (ECF subfamily)
MEEIIEPTQTDINRTADQQGVALLKAGNIEGLAALVREHQVRAVHAALLITCDRGLAEDVVQDAFLQVYRKIAQFDDSRPFSPWFLRIVINAAKKAARKQGRTLPLEEPGDGNAVEDWLIDPSESPAILIEASELSEQVWQAIERLTPDQREAIVLRYFLDSKESEMVKILGKPAPTIKWRLHAARKRLRKWLHPVGKSRLGKKEVSHE